MPIPDALLAALNSLKQAIRSKPVQDRDFDIEEDNTQQFFVAMDNLGAVTVLIGIPEATNNRPDSPIGNAAIGYIQETGSPLQNIPPRPFLVPGVVGSQLNWLPQLQSAALAALNGKTDEMNSAFERAGMIASDAVKLKITDGIPPPLKRPRYRSGQAPQQPSEATPLIDTGSLLRSVTYVVQKKGG